MNNASSRNRQPSTDKKTLAVFENLSICSGSERYATRNQIKKLFDVPKKTLSDNIARLKKDGLIRGAKIRLTAKDGKKYNTEVFNLPEVIKIGFRLRSEFALDLQDFASALMVDKYNQIVEEKRMLEIELSYAWNKSDIDELYKRTD